MKYFTQKKKDFNNHLFSLQMQKKNTILTLYFLLITQETHGHLNGYISVFLYQHLRRNVNILSS